MFLEFLGKIGLLNHGGKIIHYLFQRKEALWPTLWSIDEDAAMEYKNEVDKIKNTTDQEYKVLTDQLLLVRESHFR